jgi:hypothetical protein
MAFKIEKGYEIPTTARRGPGQSQYPFREMEIGDSFFVPVKRVKAEDGTEKVEIVRPPLPNAKKPGDRKFVSRIEKNKKGEATGVRVWRVADKADDAPAPAPAAAEASTEQTSAGTDTDDI